MSKEHPILPLRAFYDFPLIHSQEGRARHRKYIDVYTEAIKQGRECSYHQGPRVSDKWPYSKSTWVTIRIEGPLND